MKEGKDTDDWTSASATPKHHLAYNPATFLPLPRTMNLGSMTPPLIGISPKAATSTQAPCLFPTYASGGMLQTRPSFRTIKYATICDDVNT